MLNENVHFSCAFEYAKVFQNVHPRNQFKALCAQTTQGHARTHLAPTYSKKLMISFFFKPPQSCIIKTLTLFAFQNPSQ